MLIMVLKMITVTALIVMISLMTWIWVCNEKLSMTAKIVIGLIYSACAIFSTHVGVNYVNMVLNVRDLAPLVAGVFFDPLSGLIAGFVGGIERYIAGTYFGVGTYTKVACSISTCLAGVIGAGINIYGTKGKRLSGTYAFFLGAVMEVFHMYAVIITHRDDMRMAFKVVDACSVSMIAFTAIGMVATAILIEIYTNGFAKFTRYKKNDERPIAQIFQERLFIIMLILVVINSIGAYVLQTASAYQNATYILNQSEENIKIHYSNTKNVSENVKVGNEGTFCIYDDVNGKIKQGAHRGETFSSTDLRYFANQVDKRHFEKNVFGSDALCKVTKLDSNNMLLIIAPTSEIFWFRNIEIYETGFSAILLFSVVYVLISFIVRVTVVDKIDSVNNSLEKITNGDLGEVVNVRGSLEFVSLSDDINETVKALKGYIADAKKRIEQELEFARSVQKSALPTVFSFKGHDELNLYAMMDPAKEVGGDFYDFFFIDINKIALVVADVSGKGIPGALFMMRAKTAIRSMSLLNKSLSEILFDVNNTLCEGNEADMFVTTWVGILDLTNGNMECANYGHEYPIVMRANGDYEIFEDQHSLPMASYENTKAKAYNIKLEKGDRIFVYTDGIPEAINRSNEQYGMDRLIAILNANKDCNLEDRLKKVREDVANFADGAEQFDDITLLECKFNKYSKKTIRSDE